MFTTITLTVSHLTELMESNLTLHTEELAPSSDKLKKNILHSFCHLVADMVDIWTCFSDPEATKFIKMLHFTVIVEHFRINTYK